MCKYSLGNKLKSDINPIYPYSKRRVLFSLMLAVSSTIFIFLIVREIFLVLLFLVCSSLFTAFFFFVKFYLYSKKTQDKLTSCKVEEERTLIWGLPSIICLLFVSVFVPIFLLLALLFFLDFYVWVVFIAGLIVGANIPEVILYLYFLKAEREK